jgi:CDGSH-type Zn-finger protein
MKLTIIENGPIVLDTEGQVSVSAGDASEDKAGPLFLCRCGQSSTKPFCDGTHRKVKFVGPSGELVVG